MVKGECENGKKPMEIPRCVVCGGYAPFFCDYEISPGQICSAPLCGQCRANFGIHDYCPKHLGLQVARREVIQA